MHANTLYLDFLYLKTFKVEKNQSHKNNKHDF